MHNPSAITLEFDYPDNQEMNSREKFFLPRQAPQVPSAIRPIASFLIEQGGKRATYELDGYTMTVSVTYKARPISTETCAACGAEISFNEAMEVAKWLVEECNYSLDEGPLCSTCGRKRRAQ